MKIQTKDIAIIAIYGALYVALTVYFQPISYGAIQVRVANVMLATVPLLGIAGVFGQTMGVFVANLYSPELGPIDLLNTLPSLVMSFVIYYVYKRTKNDYTVIGTGIAYSAVLGVTVGCMLNYVVNLPLLATIAYVTFGNIIACVVLGWPVFMVLKRSGVFEWFNRGEKYV
ncbi:MAG: QueT transporter family protein [Nitrososphaerota archaeon]|nr:QueT transporter family protein [Nitrososphaerota archaeon]